MADEELSIVQAVVIGDPHFKAKELVDCDAYIDAAVAAVSDARPDFVVLLGDTLDTFSIVRIQPYRRACTFIERLAAITKVYVLIGNHDLVNSSVYLSDEHVFGPLRLMKNVVIVDKPIFVTEPSGGKSSAGSGAGSAGYRFVFTPYVPPGRLLEALDSTLGSGKWRHATCVFAHQEFKGCKMGMKESTIGDEWDESCPPVISGHIHDEQLLENRVFYPGSSRQHSYAESPDKVIWNVSFSQPPTVADGGITYHDFDYERISLHIKGKKIVYMYISDIDSFDVDELNRYHIKLSLTGSYAEIKAFRRSKKCKTLQAAGARITYTPKELDSEGSGDEAAGGTGASDAGAFTFTDIFTEMIGKSEDPLVKSLYDRISATGGGGEA